MKLDRKRSFATIIGERINGVAYQQDGHDFDVHDNLVDEPKSSALDEPSPPKVSLPEPDPEPEPEDSDDGPATAPKIKQWTKTAVINHIKMRFPGEFVKETESIGALKNQLRALYAVK